MSARDELATTILHHPWLPDHEGLYTGLCTSCPGRPISGGHNSPSHADHLADAVLAAGYRKPRTITTEAELESLPIGSVIWAFDYQAGDANSWQLFDDVVQLTDEDGDIAKRAWVSSAYQDEHSSNRVLLRTNGHPITVLYEPTP